MKEARPVKTRFLLLTALILSSSVFQAQAYYHPEEGRWISRDPINEQGVGISRWDTDDPEEENILKDAREYLLVAEQIDRTTGKPRTDELRQFVNTLSAKVALSRTSLVQPAAEVNLYLAMLNNPTAYTDPIGLNARVIALEICQWDGPLPIGDLIGLGILACCVLAEPHGCYPCNPPVFSTSYQVHAVPPAKPHWPHKGTHTHHYQMHQSPWPMCRCFWLRDYVWPTGGSSPLPGEEPWTPPGGGGTY